ncbi:unnamed protein product [Ambrosiozyma monospora]|uniref:Unnamed protein product n=1 Tax=Ambrosiozyma monospora TaxID=43982 RepID=A0A9W6T3L9_AMBMO|nr:unnamed protein product [Ambrosiozyma monospora]
MSDRLKSARRSALKALQFLVQAGLMVQVVDDGVDNGKNGNGNGNGNKNRNKKKRKRIGDDDGYGDEEGDGDGDGDGDGYGDGDEVCYEQVGTHIFRSEELNCIVRSGFFYIDESIFCDGDHISIEGFR